MKENHTINVVKDFSKRPYGRYQATDGDFCGENFRKNLLTPALHRYSHVHVELDGYNRYGRSFLDEAFGGLIREDGFTLSDLQNRLSYSHTLVPTIVMLITDRLEAAQRDQK